VLTLRADFFDRMLGGHLDRTPHQRWPGRSHCGASAESRSGV
jgi:hypothetical protein